MGQYMKKAIFIITEQDAAAYRKSLIAVRKRLKTAYDRSEDGSYKRWFTTHDPVLADLISELS